jgi:hypothetical protein
MRASTSEVFLIDDTSVFIRLSNSDLSFAGELNGFVIEACMSGFFSNDLLSQA